MFMTSICGIGGLIPLAIGMLRILRKSERYDNLDLSIIPLFAAAVATTFSLFTHHAF